MINVDCLQAVRCGQLVRHGRVAWCLDTVDYYWEEGEGGSERIITENLLQRTLQPSHNKILKEIKEEEMGRACGTCRDAKFIDGLDRETRKLEAASNI